MTDHDLPTHTEGETLDLPEGVQGFRPGQVLGERYVVRGLLGRGGMGEVWHAFDLKLRVEVALKALRPEVFRSERRLELLRDEVRAAREVVSPNVCRIFDLIEIDGRELVSMEYVDGATLLAVLTERGPLELKEAQDVASQFLAGLEAIHKVGLVHRDIKPENIMLTRAGRVVVMDFGLARQEAEGGGSVSGTPAYMSPEQAAGQTLDARADVYSAGVVLAEMVCPDGIKNLQSRQSVWEGVRSEPAKVPATPWAAVIKKAVAKDREARFHTAHTLTRALEDVTLRVEGAEDLHPYPGLASFTEEDAEYFFGREAEVEQMWRKLEGPPRMLGLVGPSGAGKSSYLRAGLFSTNTTRWTTAICTPGSNPQLGLGRAMARAMTGDADVTDLLLRFDVPDVAVDVLARWRRRSDHALLVVDQFEELFTQNSSDVQQRFAGLLERLVLEADVHVLLSMRDDFMIRCRDFGALQPTFADLTALPTLSGAALRRALTQPALQCGYRFEDDELVDEMLAEVEGERGALPLLAFAAARLWEKRDRDRGLLTRQAYHDIGGVGGALARHAEATVDRIGHERIPIVRELFRNLVTAEGTRAVREWNELLSVFGSTNEISASNRASGDPSTRSSDSLAQDDRCGAAEEVLRELIDARLLTSYEVKEEDREPTRRVEIIHESLLANWPRLVGWSTQDADASRLRDELRQAARIWAEHDRSDDLLWTGSAYREYTVWRERYPGGLTELEEAFADAMKSLATRRRRRRRAVVAGAFAALLVVLAVVGVSRQQAIAGAERAEASRLLTLAELELNPDPALSNNTTALAFTLASLELVDDPEARRQALEVLWRGPMARHLGGATRGMAFTSDGTLLAKLSEGDRILLWPRDGSAPTVLPRDYSEFGNLRLLAVPRRPALVVARGRPTTLEVWSTDEVRLLNEFELDANVAVGVPDAEHVVTLETEGREVRAQRRPLDGGDPVELGALDTGHFESYPAGYVRAEIGDATVVSFAGGSLYRHDLRRGDVRTVVLGRHDHPIRAVALHQERRVVAVADTGGRVAIWSLDPPRAEPVQVFSGDTKEYLLAFDAAGSKVAAASLTGVTTIWDLTAPPDARPLTLRRKGAYQHYDAVFDPAGRWVASVDLPWHCALWPLSGSHPHVFEGSGDIVHQVAFSSDGSRLYAAEERTGIRIIALTPDAARESRLVTDMLVDEWTFTDMAVDAAERIIVFPAGDGSVWVVPLGEGEPRRLEGFGEKVWSVAVSPDGRRVAAAGPHGGGIPKTLRVWDLESGAVTVFDPVDGPGGREIMALRFSPDGDRVISSGWDGVRIWSIEKRTSVYLGDGGRTVMTEDGHRLYMIAPKWQTLPGGAGVYDMTTGAFTRFPAHKTGFAIALDPTETVLVTGGDDGAVRVGPISGEEPHLLLGHGGRIMSVAVSHDGRWIASGDEDGTIRVWPMPDVNETPFHLLPHDELVRRLRAMTNSRAIEDPDTPSGYRIDYDPFPGWETVPTW